MLISAQKKCLLDTSVVIENVRKKVHILHYTSLRLLDNVSFLYRRGRGGGGIRIPNISTSVDVNICTVKYCTCKYLQSQYIMFCSIIAIRALIMFARI